MRFSRSATLWRAVAARRTCTSISRPSLEMRVTVSPWKAVRTTEAMLAVDNPRRAASSRSTRTKSSPAPPCILSVTSLTPSMVAMRSFSCSLYFCSPSRLRPDRCSSMESPPMPMAPPPMPPALDAKIVAPAKSWYLAFNSAAKSAPP